MPAYIDTILDTGTPLEVGDMIMARLQGAHFDAPFDRTTGEGPEEYLLSITVRAERPSQPRLQRLGDGVIAIAERNVMPLFSSFPIPNHIEPAVGALPWLLPYFQLAAHISHNRLDDIHLVCLDRIRLVHERAAPLARIYFEFASLLLPRLKDNLWRIADILEGLLKSDTDLAHQFALTSATRFPIAFSKGSLRICTDLVLDEHAPESEHVSDIIRELLDSARLHLDKNQYIAVIHELRSLLFASVTTPKTTVLRNAVLVGAERSEIPAADILQLEQCHWNAITVPNPADAPEFDSARKQIRDRLRRAFQHRMLSHETGRTQVTINEIPYAEAMYFHLLCLLATIDDDICIDLRPVPWNRVGTELFAGRLDIAVYNETILTHPSPTTEQRRVRRSRSSVFEYRDYVVLISTKRLRSILCKDDLDIGVRNVLTSLLDGRAVSWETVGVAKQSLWALFNEAHIAVQDDTDLYVALEDSLYRLGDFKLDALQVDDLDQDLGLERLLDGKVDLYIGGAIHSHYAMTAFPGRVRVLFDRVGESSDCYLFSTAAYFKSNRDLVERIGGLWRQAVWMWNQLLQKEHDNGRGAFYEAIRRYLLRQVNCSRSITAAFARSFDDLVHLSARHNVLTPWERNKLNEGWISQKLKKLPSPSAKRSVTQRALKDNLAPPPSIKSVTKSDD